MKTPSPLTQQVAGNHYKKLRIQPVEFCAAHDIAFAKGLAIRYIIRHQDKAGAEDLKKAIHCIALHMELRRPRKWWEKLLGVRKDKLRHSEACEFCRQFSDLQYFALMSLLVQDNGDGAIEAVNLMLATTYPEPGPSNG